MSHTALTQEETQEFQDSPQDLEKKIEQLAVLIQNSANFTVWTGAGISTGAGVPDFRSWEFGKWALQARGATLDPKVFKAVSTLAAKPSLTHMALVTLLRSGHLKKIISSNTDGLHRRSGVLPSEIAELHGNSNKARCNKCNLYCYADQRVRVAKPVHSHGTGVQCPRCGAGSEMEDTIVNFGEYLEPAVSQAANGFGAQADLLLVLGSSLRVITCDALDQIRAKKGGKLVVINKQKTPYDKFCAVRIFASVDEVMQRLVEVKLGRQIMPWILNRFVKISCSSVGDANENSTTTTNNNILRKLQIQGVDEVGNVFSWIAKVELGVLETITKKNDPESSTFAALATPPPRPFRLPPMMPSTSSPDKNATTAAKRSPSSNNNNNNNSMTKATTAAAAKNNSASASSFPTSNFTTFASAVPELPKGVFLPISLECNRPLPILSATTTTAAKPTENDTIVVLRLHPSSHRGELPCDINVKELLLPALFSVSNRTTEQSQDNKTKFTTSPSSCDILLQLQYDHGNGKWTSKVVGQNKIATSRGTAAVAR